MSDWNDQIIAEFRGNHGKVGGNFAGRSMLLLHTQGRRSGQTRVNPVVYQRHFGGPVTCWDPTNVAIPMQFNALPGGGPLSLEAPDGRLFNEGRGVADLPREKAWLVTSLQDQTPWIKKQQCKWPVIVVGNKRKAREGEGLDYIPEREVILNYYTKYWGHLAFGYPLAEGGWWRMRYVHAALAGIVTCCDENDARRMPEDYRHSRIMLERWSDDKLREVAHNQFIQLMDSAWSTDQAVNTVDAFVKGLVC